MAAIKAKILSTYFHLLAKLAKKYIAKHKPFVIGIHGSVGKTSCRLIISQTLDYFFPNKIIYTSPKNFNGELGMPLSIFQIQESNPTIIGFIKQLRQA
jgi:UDP-N-acetylmuramyl pentapeptide synthase